VPGDTTPDSAGPDTTPDSAGPDTAPDSAEPDTAQVSELCKLIDAANDGTAAAKASAGAVANALDTLARHGRITRTVDRPATFQLA
jgi:hypothetical protein